MSSVPRRFLLIGLFALALVAPTVAARADTAPDARQFIKKLVDTALQVLAQTKGGSETQREQTFDNLLNQNFDMPRIARFVLGRYWTGASEAERRKFVDTYREFIIRSYASRFSEYSGETVKVMNSRPESADITIVNSEIVLNAGEPGVKISWRVHQSGGDFKIVDVDVEGISMMLSQREEFASVIQHNGGTVSGLIQAIERKLQSGDLSLNGR